MISSASISPMSRISPQDTSQEPNKGSTAPLKEPFIMIVGKILSITFEKTQQKCPFEGINAKTLTLKECTNLFSLRDKALQNKISKG